MHISHIGIFNQGTFLLLFLPELFRFTVFTNLRLFECEGNSISPLNVYCLPGNTTAELILREVEQEKLSYVFTGRTVCLPFTVCVGERMVLID